MRVARPAGGQIALRALREASAVYVFVDIRGFSSWSKDNSEEITKLLRRTYSLGLHLYERDDVHSKSRVVKFLGDGFFAASEYSDRRDSFEKCICRCIIDSVTMIEEFDRYLRDTNLHQPDRIGLGIGISYGQSSRIRAGNHPVDYVGMKVTLGSRLCSAASASEILLEEACEKYVRKLQRSEEIHITRKRGARKLKGLDTIKFVRVYAKQLQ